VNYAERQLLPPIERLLDPIFEKFPAARISFFSSRDSMIRIHVNKLEGQRSIKDMFSSK
jgi:hypothetical protein